MTEIAYNVFIVQVILKDQSRGEGLVRTLSMKFSDYSEVKCSQINKVKTPELEKFLEVPWELPKLRKKIAHRKTIKTLVNIQGSDSGISMSSQETKDMTIPAWTTNKMKQKSQFRLFEKSTHDGSDSAQAEDYATAEDDSESERYSSYPRKSVNANNEFHFQPRGAGNHFSNH